MKYFIMFTLIIVSHVIPPINSAFAKIKNDILITVPSGHGSGILAIRFSPDGALIATASMDSTIKLWDAQTGHLLRTLKGHKSWVQNLAFSKDGQHLISAAKDSFIWEVATGKRVHILPAKEGSPGQPTTYAVVFSQDGKLALTADNSASINIWNASTGKFIKSIYSLPVNYMVSEMVITPDNRTLIFSDFNHQKIIGLDIPTGKKKFEFLTGKTGAFGMALSPDGKHIVLGTCNGVIQAWKLATRKKVLSKIVREATNRNFGNCIETVTFSANGESFATGARDGKIKLWRFADFENLGEKIAVPPNWSSSKDWQTNKTTKVDTKQVSALAFSPINSLLVSGGTDAKLKFWQGETLEISVLHDKTRVLRTSTKFVISKDNRTVITGSEDGTLFYWDINRGLPVRQHKVGDCPLRHVESIDSEAKLLVLCGKTISILDTHTGAELKSIQLDDIGPLAATRKPFGFITGGVHDTSLTAVEWGTSKSHKVFKTQKYHQHTVLDIDIHPTQNFAASTGADGLVLLWLLKEGKTPEALNFHLWKKPGAFLYATAFSPKNARIAIAGRPHRPPETLALWDPKSKKLLAKTAVHEGVRSLAYSRDGSLLAAGGEDSQASLWKSEQDKLTRLSTLKGHASAVTGLQFTPDKKRLVTVSNDSSLRLWNVSDGSLIASFYVGSDGDWLVIIPEGYLAGSYNLMNKLQFTTGERKLRVRQVFQALYRPDLVAAKLAGDPENLVKTARSQLDIQKVLNSGVAPVVTFATDISNVEINADSANFEVAVKDLGGGIGRIEWRVNGTTLGVRRADQTTAYKGTEADKIQNLKQSLWLQPGKNIIEVVAYNAQNLIASELASIVIENKKPANQKGRLYVLTIGVNQYADQNLKLNLATDDAKQIAASIKKSSKELYDEVIVHSLFNQDVTIPSIDVAFSRLEKTIRPQDTFVFFIAGHGKTVDGRYYFLPQNIPEGFSKEISEKGFEPVKRVGIDQSHWQDWFAKIAARKSLLLYDTCESGGLAQEGLKTVELERLAALERLTRAMGRAIFSASTATTPALEGHKGHGVFTYALLESLGKADGNSNDKIELSEIAAYIKTEVKKISEQHFGVSQEPQTRIVGENFPLALKTDVLEPSE